MPHAWDADPILRDGRTAGWANIEQMVEAFALDRIARFRTHAEMLAGFSQRLAQAAARHGLWALFVNQVGRPHPCIPFVGPSFAADPEGKVVARSPTKREGMLLVEVP